MSEQVTPDPSNVEPLWTVEEVAAYLRLEPETVRIMARDGKLPAIKVGRVWRFNKLMLDEHFAQKFIASTHSREGGGAE